MNMKELGKEINVVNRANGWVVFSKNDWVDSYKIPTSLALIHSKVSEALEAFRNDDFDNFREELADFIIRALNLADGLEIDIDEEVYKKLEKNRQRSYRHGGKKV